MVAEYPGNEEFLPAPLAELSFDALDILRAYNAHDTDERRVKGKLKAADGKRDVQVGLEHRITRDGKFFKLDWEAEDEDRPGYKVVLSANWRVDKDFDQNNVNVQILKMGTDAQVEAGTEPIFNHDYDLLNDYLSTIRRILSEWKLSAEIEGHTPEPWREPEVEEVIEFAASDAVVQKIAKRALELGIGWRELHLKGEVHSEPERFEEYIGQKFRLSDGANIDRVVSVAQERLEQPGEESNGQA